VPAPNDQLYQDRILQLEEQLRVKDQQIEALIKAINHNKEEERKLPEHYVLCTKVGGIVRKRSDSIARSLKNAHYPVIKTNNKFYCDPAHAAVIFPKWKTYLKKKFD